MKPKTQKTTKKNTKHKNQIVIKKRVQTKHIIFNTLLNCTKLYGYQGHSEYSIRGPPPTITKGSV